MHSGAQTPMPLRGEGMKLSTRYGLQVGAAVVLTAMALGTLIHHNVRNILQEQAIARQLAIAHGIMGKIDDALKYARRDMRILVEDEFLKVYVADPSSRTERNRVLLANELRERSEFTGPWDDVMVLDRDGNYLLTTQTHPAHVDLAPNQATLDAFRAALGGTIYSSDLVTPDSNDLPTLIYAAPIRAGADETSGETGKDEDTGDQEKAEEQGAVVGVVIAHYRWDSITRILTDDTRDSAIYLYDRNGDVLAEHRQGDNVNAAAGTLLHANVHRALVAKGVHESVRPTRYQYETVLSAHVVQQDSKGWGVLVEQPEAVVFAPARQLALRAMLITVGVLGLLALALTLLGYRLLQPLARLTRLTERIGGGDFQHRLDYRSRDEIGILANSFNTMLDRLERGRAELVAAQHHIQNIVDTVPGILYSATPDHLRTTFISPAVIPLLGYDINAFLAAPTLRTDLILKSERAAVLAEIEDAKTKGIDFSVTYRMRHRDGRTTRWFEDRGRWECDADGRPVALHGVMTDITDRKNREEELARTSRALDILHGQDVLLTHADAEYELVYGVCDNLAAQENYRFVWIGLLDADRPAQLNVAAMAGDDPELAIALTRLSFDCRDDSYIACAAVRERQPRIVRDTTSEPVFCLQDSEIQRARHTALISLPLLNDNNILGALNIYSDNGTVFDDAEQNLLAEVANNLAYGITALRIEALHNQAQERLSHQAFHDTLTDLPNRAMFLESLKLTLAHAERSGEILAVLFIDLDDFKLVNDPLGHVAGDELLRQVAGRIVGSVRGGDMVARQGGDEFIVLMRGNEFSETPPAQAASPEQQLLNPGRQAQRLVERLRQPFVIEGQESYVGASIGVAIYPHDAQDADTLLRYADSAMYRAKELGRGGYAFYSAELTERQHHRMYLANRLHQALERKQFLLYYQPIIELGSGKLAGAEALIRWLDDDGRLIPPGDFLPVAEDTGIIIAIGEWVLAEACRQINEWQQMGHPLSVAINVSARQLWHGENIDRILATITACEVDTRLLELEITESAMGRDPRHMENAFLRFHQGGLKISLDDFGTGYSSLSRLKQLPITTLKVDRSFVDGVPSTEDDTAIVGATLQMAHSLGLNALAEGIETPAQWKWLREHGCRYGQGYYFSQPLPAAEMTALLRQGKRWELDE